MLLIILQLLLDFAAIATYSCQAKNPDNFPGVCLFNVTMG